MPRASRYLVEGYTYHLTHRCHDRRFLLKFSRERQAYREWLRIAAQRYGVPVYGYCITSNHVHVIVHATDRHDVGRLMQLPSGAVARQLNARKQHEGSVWEHPYQCTMIEDGRHLLNCLRYVDLNMVRCGTVKHPEAWRWCGYDELIGTRQRYRIIDIDRLLQSLDLDSHAELTRLHTEGIREQIALKKIARAPHWTEALAVGSKEFVEHARSQYRYRQSFVETGIETDHEQNTWILRESPAAYMPDSGRKSPL